MSDIVEVIHKINFEVEGQRSLNASADEIGKMIASIDRLQTEIRELTELFKKTGDPATKSRIRGLTDEMNAQKNAVTSNITENKRLQQALQAEMRQISSLRSQLDQLEKARKDDITQIRKQQQEIKRLNAEMAKVKSGGLFGRIGGIGNLLGFTGGALLASGIQSTVSFLKDAVKESIQMGLELEGVERAFRRIGDPSLLDGLREATRGTVSDLELMKQAVQFRNFGLPIEQLATMLEFARMRAQETGQSIDYMVNSIVTGVARKSIMIIDNLGISAERVRDAMKETGDFASAVALIIQQDMAAAGDTFDIAADKLARITAELDNIKARSGQTLSAMVDYAGTFLSGAFSALFDWRQWALRAVGGGGPLTAGADAVSLLSDQRQMQRWEKLGQDMAERVYGAPFQQAAEAFRKADLKNRRTILDQAQLMYQSEVALAKEAYADNEQALTMHLAAIRLVYNRFIESARNAPVNILQLTDRDIATAPLEQLNQWLQTLGESRNTLNAEDAVAIEQYNAMERRLKLAIDSIKGTTRATGGLTAEQRRLNAELERQKRILDEARESLRAAGDPRLLQFDQPNLRVRPPRQGLTSEQIEDLRRGSGVFPREQRGPEPTVMGPYGPLRLTPENLALEERTKKEQEAKVQAVKDANMAIWQNSVQLHNNIISLIQTEDAIRKAALDSQISMQQMRLDAALRLSERGNDELLQIEMNRMEKLQEERERMARRQVATNAAVQASSAALAAVQAITTITTSGATGGVPGVIAAGIALAATIPAMLALVQSLTAQASRGFASGGYTGDGPKMSIAGSVHKGEFVFNKEITAKYRPVFEEIHRTGQMPQYITNNTSAQAVDLAPLVEAFRQGQIVQEINFDEHGIGVMTRRSARADKRRWRGR